MNVIFYSTYHYSLADDDFTRSFREQVQQPPQLAAGPGDPVRGLAAGARQPLPRGGLQSQLLRARGGRLAAARRPQLTAAAGRVWRPQVLSCIPLCSGSL